MDTWNTYQNPRENAPIHEGENHQVKIESVGREGDGIARINGFVVFIPNTQVGDELTIRITKVANRVAFAEPADTG